MKRETPAPSLLCAAVLLCCPALGRAQETAAFLKIGVGARPMAMGGAFTAVADDINALAWNPAGLSLLSRRELGAMHAELAADTRYDFVGYGHPARHGTLALGAARLGHGPLEGRDASGKATGGFGATDTALSAAFAAGLAGGLRVGGGVKYVASGIADASGQTFAVDLGAMLPLGRLGPGALRGGLAAQNLGPGIRLLEERADLPMALGAGLAYALPPGLTVALDYKHRPLTRSGELRVGTEYAVLPAASMRMGYSTAAPGTRGDPGGLRGLGGLGGLGAGLGVRLAGYTVDYSFAPLGELGSAQRISLGIRF